MLFRNYCDIFFSAAGAMAGVTAGYNKTAYLQIKLFSILAASQNLMYFKQFCNRGKA
jgi:hypothetical protein